MMARPTPSGITARELRLGALHFVEATPPAVVVTPAADFWRRASHATLYAGRLVGARMRALGAAATQAASAQAGTPYASDFEPPPAKFYCSSLVEWAFGVAAGEKSVFLPPGLTFKLLFEPLGFWERYYHGLNQSLPVNVSGSNPTLLLHSPAVRFTTLRPEDVVANL